jgi:hypothetical protein
MKSGTDRFGGVDLFILVFILASASSIHIIATQFFRNLSPIQPDEFPTSSKLSRCQRLQLPWLQRARCVDIIP